MQLTGADGVREFSSAMVPNGRAKLISFGRSPGIGAIEKLPVSTFGNCSLRGSYVFLFGSSRPVIAWRWALLPAVARADWRCEVAG
jgi:hypothetical protein